jgi:superfamily II DNA or RNA helicase
MSKIIIKDNRYAKLEEMDLVFLGKVNKLLSFKMTGVEYSPAYKNTGWDGTTYIMNKKKEFPLGLIKMVKDFYSENNKDIIIEDLRKPFEANSPIDIVTKLKSMGKTPRNYQEEACFIFDTQRRGIIRAATGAGKSVIAAMIAARINKPFVLYVIGLDLLKQMWELFNSVFEEPIGLVGGGVCKIERINIVSVWTVGKALDLSDKDMFIMDDSISKEEFNDDNKYKIINMLNNAKVHVFDECHMCACSTIQSIYKNIDPETIIGLSGTPWRDSGDDILINAILGENVIDISAERLINAGVLVPPTIKFVNVPCIYTTGSTYQEIYKQCVVESPV